MKKAYISVLTIMAVDLANLCHSQEFVAESHRDRVTFSLSSGNPLALPPVGAVFMRILSAELLELVRITPDTATWDFSQSLPATSAFQVKKNGAIVNNAVLQVGYRRRVLYAPILQTAANQRIENSLYLKLADGSISDGDRIEVTYTPESIQFLALKDPLRYSRRSTSTRRAILPLRDRIVQKRRL